MNQMDKTFVARILVLVAAGLSLAGVTFAPDQQAIVSQGFFILVGLASGLKVWKRWAEKKENKSK